MRITTKMMTNNMMSNINKNKIRMSNLEQQYSTQKKIQRPSEDPIIAVRALKLRTNLSELEQYFDKNIPDAFSWMDVTESALTTMNDLLREMNTYCVQGSTDTLTANYRSSIIQNLMQMKAQFYQEGNTNYAGRYVFTGYKTDTSLIFAEDTSNLSYNITEELSGLEIESSSKVTGSYTLEDADEPIDYFADAPKLVDYHRLQLSYDQLDEGVLNLSYYETADEDTPTDVLVEAKSLEDGDAYSPGADQAFYIAETGEIILGENIYKNLRDANKITVNYSKSNFKEGDLRPEHYFDCVRTDLETGKIVNFDRPDTKQEIQYEVNFNQKLTVNTEGLEAISHKIGRVIDEILNSVNEVIETEGKIAEIERRLKSENLTDAEKEKYEKMLEQLDTELELKKEVMQESFEKGNLTSSKEQDRVNIALADLGSRYVRLQLTENRLSSQKVDFTELMSNNEGVNLVDTVIAFGSAEVVYNASLNAASRVVRNSLLDFLR